MNVCVCLIWHIYLNVKDCIDFRNISFAINNLMNLETFSDRDQ